MNCKKLFSKKYIPSNNEIFTVIYFGVIGKPRFLLELVDVMKELPDIKCIIGGSGSKIGYVNELIEKCRLIKNVDFIGRVPMEEVIPMTLKSDAVIHMIDPLDSNNTIGLANKQFEAMVCGRPIIISEGSYAGELVEKLNCGLVVRRRKEDLKKAIEKLRDNPEICKKLGENALKAEINEYNWDNQEEKLIKLINKIKN
jgi:glycosyltransferase involved in cell wall biosynthesis